MRNSIFYEIQTSVVCPYRLLFLDDYFCSLSESDPFKYANIYLFAKVKKIRFDLSHTKLLNKRTLKTIIYIGKDITKEFSVSFFDFVPIFKNVFETKEKFEDLLSDDDDYWSCKIDFPNSSSDKIHFLQYTKTGEQYDFWLIPENLETAIEINNDLDFDNKPEVVYVGQSFHMSKRIKAHKTLHKAVSRLNDHEEIRIYFLTFKYGYGGHEDFIDLEGQVFNTWLSKYGNSKEHKDRICLVERFLIHFLKPIYNEQHVNTDIVKDSLVKSILLRNNIDVMTINIGVYGKAFEFWSPYQRIKTDYTSFNFLTPELGYQEGLITNEI